MRRIFIILLTVSTLATACSSGVGSEAVDANTQTQNLASSDTATDEPQPDSEASQSSTAITSDGDSLSTSDQNTDQSTESNSNADTDTNTDSSGVATPNNDLVSGSDCTIDQFPRRVEYVVSGIADDDPDGGLVMRSDPGSGDQLGVLAESQVALPSLETCEVTDDGGVWWSVTEDYSAQSGWVNSAWLTSELGPNVPLFYEAKTKQNVMLLLDSLADGDWTTALSVLIGEGIPAQVEAQVGDLYGADAALNLAAYCETHICDAPYEILESTGVASGLSSSSPTVTVRFSYPEGDAIEVFRGLIFEGNVDAVSPLPGKSSLALQQPLPSFEQVLHEKSDEVTDLSLSEAVEYLRIHLISESGPQIPAEMIPNEGIIMSARTSIVPDSNPVVTAADLADGSKDFVFEYDESGLFIESVDEWMNDYRRNLTLIEPDSTSVDVALGFGNSLNNLAESFPDAHVVEFHREGRGELKDFNWASTRLVLEQRDGEWKLLAIMGDTWTI